MLLRLTPLMRIVLALATSAFLVFAITLSASAVTPASGPANGGTTVTIDGIEFVQVSTTMTHTLALTNQGTVYAWGNNFGGALGDGTTTNRSAPVQVKGVGGVGYLTGVTSIAAGGWFSIASTADGVVAWGYNGSGQLGDGTTNDRSTPVEVKSTSGSGRLIGITQVCAGVNHTVALSNTNVYSWGLNHLGQLGNGTYTTSSVPVGVKDTAGTGFLTGATEISCGGNHNLAIVSGSVVAWGFNGSGQLGTNNQANSALPTPVLGNGGTGQLSGMDSISCGSSHSLASGSSGVFAWGSNGSGQLGDGTTSTRLTPVQVLGVGGTGTLQNVTGLGSGLLTSLAITPTGAFAWGLNPYGELGDNSTTTRNSPIQILGVGGTGTLTNVTSIDGGEYFTVAVVSGAAFAWGSGSGKIGNGSNSGSPTPTSSANFQPASITFGSSLGTNMSSSGSQWSVVSPSGNTGPVSLTAVANVFGGTTAANPSTYSWSAGSFTYTAAPSNSSTTAPVASSATALAKTGVSNYTPLFIGSGIAVLLGVGLLIALRRQNRR